MLAWLQATANWAGPIASILNLLIAAVGLPLGLVKGYQARRVIVAWVASILGNTQDASHQSTRAADNAEASNANAAGARENSRQANELLEWALPEIMKRDAVIEEMKGRIDRLLGTRVKQLVTERTGQLLIPVAAADEDDPATETGRHRLHTTATPTFPTFTSSFPDDDS